MSISEKRKDLIRAKFDEIHKPYYKVTYSVKAVSEKLCVGERTVYKALKATKNKEGK